MNKYLIEILKSQNSVILPGFGALMIASAKTGKIVFNPLLKSNSKASNSLSYIDLLQIMLSYTIFNWLIQKRVFLGRERNDCTHILVMCWSCQVWEIISTIVELVVSQQWDTFDRIIIILLFQGEENVCFEQLSITG